MRLIYAFLAVRMLRRARYDLARSELLYRNGDEAFDRLRQAEALAARADQPSLAAIQ